MKTALPFNLLFMLTIQLCHLVYTMDCPSTVYVELGKDGIINCQISNNGDVYWYKGNSTKTSPIARLENGQKKLSQESNRYDIDEEGSLIIKNIEERNYGFYSVVNFYANDKHDTDLIKVEIAGKPQTMCPIIAGCNDCDHCVLIESETGDISCSIGGTRPQVHLNIVTDSENGINVIRNISEETYDPVTNTWNSTVTVQYSGWYDCRTPLHIRCVTENGHPFELSDSFAHMKLDSCNTTTQITEHQTPLIDDSKRIFAIAITTAVIFVVILLVLGIVLCRKLGSSQNRKTKRRDMEMQDELEPFQKTNTSSGDVESIINTFKNAFKDYEMFTSTPNGDRIPIENVFQKIYFTLAKEGYKDDTISSSKVIETLFGKERSFVFLDDGEYGRKAFMQYVCSGVCAENLDENVILYVNLKEVDRNMTIADALDKQMKFGGIGTTDVIRNIIENKKCLFVFNEVHGLNQSSGDESTVKSKNQNPGGVTINDVLRGSHLLQKYQNLRLLCISQNKTNLTSSFSKCQVYIRITQFSKENLKSYVPSIFKCYQNCDYTNTKKSAEETMENGDDGNKDEPSGIGHTYDEQHVTCVTDLILDEENIIKQMHLCPSSLILFTHALVSDISKKAIENLTFYIHRRSYLTQLILSCLQFQTCPGEAKYKDFELLMIKFGQVSFESSLEDTSFKKTCNFISEYTRRQLEAKTSRDDFATAFAMGLFKVEATENCITDVTDNDPYPSPDSLIKYRHNYIQEYFIARAIASNKTAGKRFLKSSALKKNDKMKRVLQFMHGSEAQKRYEWLKHLVEEESWNNLIDCLFECENDDDFKNIKSALSPLTGKYVVNIIDMDNHYHGMAVARFCELLANYSVSLKALTFRTPCKLQYFSKLRIPQVKFLVFLKIDFQQGNNFIDFVKKACQMNVKDKIQFVRCKIPNEIAKDKIEEIAVIITRSSNAPQIYQTNDEVFNADGTLNVQWFKLNLERGCWEET